MNIKYLLTPTSPVALSRAREGLYIFGNAQNLSSRSGMWGTIIEELEEKGLVGPALPIACHRHPDAVEYVSEPGQLPQIAPDGLFCCEALPVIIFTSVSKVDVLNLAKAVSIVDTSVRSRSVLTNRL
jgi:hypothetical protein